MRLATPELIMQHRPCPDYPRERVRELLGDGLTPREYTSLPIPAADRWWGMSRVWPEGVLAALNITVERAIRRRLGESGIPDWESWAVKWASGEDRSASAAARAA